MSDYGLELTNNSKASWAFSMPRSKTCIMATDVCRKLCYGNGVRYQTAGQKGKRERNFRTVELLLSKGGPDLLAENLIALIDQVRPSDWLAAGIAGEPTRTPWTLRIHDVGDWHELGYARAWRLAVQARPKCAFWFYTRTFKPQGLFEELTQLALLPNCQGWLSVDSENHEAALLAYAQASTAWKLAFLQEGAADSDDVVLQLVEKSNGNSVVSFPYHRGGRHVEPVQVAGLFTCPAVLGVYKLQSNSNNLRPCQACSFCLP